MFYRKISKVIEEHLKSDDSRIMLIDGARQIGKSFIIRHVGSKTFKNYIEVNLLNDYNGPRNFDNIYDVEAFYLQLNILAGGKLGNNKDTLVFLDEIQVYPQLITLLKFLREENKFTYIASGSSLGLALKKSVSIPMGSIFSVRMYPMDFEEFLLANGIEEETIDRIEDSFNKKESLPPGVHEKVLMLFKYYILCGGMPDAVKAFVEEQNIVKMRNIQADIFEKNSIDAAQYDFNNNLKIQKIYRMIPSVMENKKKRIVVKNIDNNKGERFDKYKDEFDYLTASGIALDVRAVPTPVFPLIQGTEKNLLKLYISDIGILTSILYGNNINPIIKDDLSINLGSVYETVVATELKAHGFDLFYYDNRKKGEVDFLIDDYNNLEVLPIEIKSGKDYSTHAALDRFISNQDYSVKQAYVFSNEREIREEGKIVYYPIYMIMFLKKINSAIEGIQPIKAIEWE